MSIVSGYELQSRCLVDGFHRVSQAKLPKTYHRVECGATLGVSFQGFALGTGLRATIGTEPASSVRVESGLRS